MPLFHKSLHPDINIDIAKYLHSVMRDPSEHSEKDKVGGADWTMGQFVHWLIDTNQFIIETGEYIDILFLYLERQHSSIKGDRKWLFRQVCSVADPVY